MNIRSWDRIYFFTFTAAVFALAGFLALLFIPLVQIENLETGEVLRLTLLQDGQNGLLLLSLLPVALTGSALLVVPKNGQPDRVAKINLWISTFLVYVFVVLFIYVNGILFIPAAILMTAAAVGSQVRRRNRTVYAKMPSELESRPGGVKRDRRKG